MEYETIYAFNGVNRNVSPFLLNKGDLAEMQNLTGEKIGTLQKSFDYSIKNSQIAAGHSILGGTDWAMNDGTHLHVVAIDGDTNAEIYIDVAGTWTTQSQSLTAGNKVRFAYSPTIDTLFVVNYADQTRSSTGSGSWSTSANVTDAPKGKYIISFGNRIYILHANVSSTAYPGRAYRSSLIDTAATWDADDYFNFDDVITGVALNNDNMFVLCQNSTHIITLADEKYQVSNIGCTSHEGVVTHGGVTYYPSNDGYYMFDGSSTRKISTAIDEYWKGIPTANLSEIQASVRNEHVYVYIGDITRPETLTNVIFDYSIAQQNWHRGSLKDNLTQMHSYVTSSGKQVFFGTDDGQVMQMFSGTLLQNGSEYTSFIETNWIYGSDPLVEDFFYEIWTVGIQAPGYVVSIKVNRESANWEPLGTIQGDMGVVKFKKRAYRVKLRFSETSGNNPFEFSFIQVGYEPAFIRNEDRDS